MGRHRVRAWGWVLLAMTCVLLVAALPSGRVGPVPVRAAVTQPASVAAAPDAVCAGCHAEISARYARTPMARGSGPVGDGLLTGGFTHGPSRVNYQVAATDAGAVLRFDRAESAPGAGDGLHGTRRLSYFVGSNLHGRTYLYQDEESRQWFEAPINFYRRRGVWAMAPNFDGYSRMPGPQPTDAGCLYCHATNVATAQPQAANALGAVPFAQGGVGCAACHGDPAAHLAAGGHGPILNPAHLTTARRDSICLQCHLEGDATVFRAGTSTAAFRPGDDLSDRAVYFVKASREAGGGRASSQWEALLRSACRRGAGDKLTCTTCHDPHGSPREAERVAWFRGKCLTCHSSAAIAVEHHPEQPDCAKCHMPTRSTTDISHEQAVDHNIQARPASRRSLRSLGSLTAAETLVPVGGVSAGDREFGLAYAQVAGSGDRAMGERAQALLAKAEQAGADDAALHAELGYLDQRAGDQAGAVREYRAALRGNPFEATALGNLAVLEAASGHAAEAVAHLKTLNAADPAKTAAALNLAYLECSLGDRAAAREVLLRSRRIDPDNEALQRFWTRGEYAGGRCTVADGARQGHVE